MASSFLISFPDIMASAMVITPTLTYDTDYYVENLMYGRRGNYARLAANNTNLDIVCDLGLGFSRTLDHLILGGTSLIKAAGLTEAHVDGSADGVSWTNQLGTVANFQTRTFNGPNGQDVIFTPTYNDTIAGTLAAYRYFRLRLSGPSQKFSFSKAYFGAFFDMGKEPDNYNLEVVSDDVDTWRYQRGHVLMTKSNHEKHRVTVEWDGVTDAKATEFETVILKNTYRNSVFLYTSTFLDPLYDNKLMHCKVLPDECLVTKESGVGNWNNITAVFEELI